MKKVILTLALFAELSALSAKAENAFTINTAGLQSGASLEVIIYAVDPLTLLPVGNTNPISVMASNNYLIDAAVIPWEGGSAPSGSWVWGYATVKLSCTGEYLGASNVCGSMSYNGVTVGYNNTDYPGQSCFEIANEDCNGTLGDGVGVQMGNSGNEGPSFPGKLYIY